VGYTAIKKIRLKGLNCVESFTKREVRLYSAHDLRGFNFTHLSELIKCKQLANPLIIVLIGVAAFSILPSNVRKIKFWNFA